MDSLCPNCSKPAKRPSGDATQPNDITVCSACGWVFDSSAIESDDETQPPDPPPPIEDSPETAGLAESTGGKAAGLGSSSSNSPQRLGNFRLIQKLGQGGFGAVWLAEDRNLERLVALKLPKPRHSNDVLLHEARTAAKLNHAHIVAIYEVGIENQQVFIASEFIDGEDLQSELSRGRPSVERAVGLAQKLASAVHHAHEQGIVHRDLKPANILIDGAGEPHIADFGIAKHVDTNETISTDGAVVGTIRYMSPEQAKGQTRQTERRSDIYSLGVILFEMLTEYCPFRGNARAVLHQKIYEDAPSPRRLVPALDKDLETICLKCLEREPHSRYATAADLAEELARYQQGKAIHARPIGRAEKLWRWCKLNPAIALLLAGIMISLTAGVVSTSYFWLRAADNAELTKGALHRAKLNSASDQWTRGDLRSLRRTLQSFEPGQPLHHLRDFSVDHYDRMLDSYAQFVHHRDSVVSVAISDDGRLFAAAGADRSVSVWKTDDGALLRTLPPQAGKIVKILFVPAGRRLVSAHATGDIHLWNPSQHARLLRSMDCGAPITAVACSGDGALLFSAGRGAAKMWSIDDDSQTQPTLFEIGPKPVIDAEFSPNDERLGIAIGNRTAQNGEVQIWNVASRERESNFATPGVQCLAFTSDKSLAAGAYGGQLWQMDMDSGEAKQQPLAGAAIGDIQQVWESDLLAVATLQPTLMIVQNGKALRKFYGPRFTFGMLAQSKSRERRFIVTSGGDSGVSLLRVDNLLQADTYWRPTHVRSLEFLSNESLAVADGDGAIARLDLQSMNAVETTASSQRELLASAFCTTTQRLAIGGMQRDVALFDMSPSDVPTNPWAWPESQHIPQSFAGVRALAFDDSGEHLLCGAKNGSLLCFETSDISTPFRTWQRSDSSVNAVCPLANASQGARFGAAFSDNTVAVVDLNGADGKFSHTISLEVEPTSLAFCPRSRRLIVGTSDGQLLAFDTSSWTRQNAIDAHAGRVNCLAVFPNGRQFVSGGRDRVVSIWDIETGEKVSDLFGHTRQVFDVAISPDGVTVASAGLSGDVHIWRSK